MPFNGPLLALICLVDHQSNVDAALHTVAAAESTVLATEVVLADVRAANVSPKAQLLLSSPQALPGIRLRLA